MGAGGSGGKMIPLLIPLSISFALGIVVALLTNASANLLAFAVLIFLGLAIYFTRARTPLVCALFFCLGAWRFSVLEENSAKQPLLNIAGDKPTLIQVRGKVVTAPIEHVSSIESNEVLSTRCHVEASELVQATNQIPIKGRLAVTLHGHFKIYKGDLVELHGLLLKPEGPMAPGLFDYASWLRTQGIFYELRVNSSNDWKTLAHDHFGRLTSWFIGWAKETLALGLPERDKELGLEWAMVLGWRSALQGEVKEPYLRSGTLHIFAISGMHIAIMSGILLVVLKTLRLPRRLAGIIVIPLIWFYTAATGWQPSAIRASVMMTIVITGWILNRPPRLLNSLAGSALLLLLHDPRELFQAGFQLSFMVVAALGIIPPLFDKVVEQFTKPDPLIPQRLIAWPVKAGLWMRRQILIAIITSFAAAAGSFALTMYYFNLASPISLIANIIVAPLSGLALSSALGSLLSGAVGLTWITEVFNHGTWFWMAAMDRLSSLFAEVPYGSWHVQKPSLIFVACCYGAMSFVIAAITHNKKFWAIALFLFFIGGGDLIVRSIAEDKKTTLTILPLGGGEALYFDPPGTSQDLLVDTGDKRAAQLLVDFVHARGADRLQNLLLTHGDIRNTGGASFLAAKFLPATTYTSAAKFRSRPYQNEVTTLTNLGLSVLNVGSNIAGWKVLLPGTNLQHRIADDVPIVLYREIQNVRVLLLSDLSQTGQRRLIEQHPGLQADIIISGIPSQGEPLIQDLIETFNPKIIVISDDDYPWTARATADVRERLKTKQVYYCSDEGAVTFEFTTRAWQLSTMRGRKHSSYGAAGVTNR